jgi:hypothetical protein
MIGEAFSDVLQLIAGIILKAPPAMVAKSPHVKMRGKP